MCGVDVRFTGFSGIKRPTSVIGTRPHGLTQSDADTADAQQQHKQLGRWATVSFKTTPHLGDDMVRTALAATLRNHRNKAYGAGAAVLVIAAIIIGVVLTNQPTPTQPIAYTNISRNYKTCLLTTTAYTTATAPDWTAIQTAARNRPINAQHLVAPSETTNDLAPYLNSLLALHCQLIITAGPDLPATLAQIAKTHPQQQFANISQTTTGLPNVHDQPDSTPTTITNLVTTACKCR